MTEQRELFNLNLFLNWSLNMVVGENLKYKTKDL